MEWWVIVLVLLAAVVVMVVVVLATRARRDRLVGADAGTAEIDETSEAAARRRDEPDVREWDRGTH